jgi:hypothetical protein
VAVEDAAERSRLRQAAQELDRFRIELRRDPLPCAGRRSRRFAVRVAADEHRLELAQPRQTLGRERTGDHVPTADDPIELECGNLREHRLERRQVAVDVVQDRDAH